MAFLVHKEVGVPALEKASRACHVRRNESEDPHLHRMGQWRNRCCMLAGRGGCAGTPHPRRERVAPASRRLYHLPPCPCPCLLFRLSPFLCLPAEEDDDCVSRHVPRAGDSVRARMALALTHGCKFRARCIVTLPLPPLPPPLPPLPPCGHVRWRSKPRRARGVNAAQQWYECTSDDYIEVCGCSFDGVPSV